MSSASKANPNHFHILFMNHYRKSLMCYAINFLLPNFQECFLNLNAKRLEIAGILTKAFAFSLDTGDVPDDWRAAKVVSLFKKGNEDNPGNYRLMSLPLVVGKRLKRVFSDSQQVLVQGSHLLQT